MIDQNQQFTLGGHQSPPDYRDIPLAAAVALPEVSTLPPSFAVDVSKLPIWNQLALGACVGHAGAKYSQEQEALETGMLVPASPRFLYAICKAKDGLQEQGTYPRIMMQARKDYGCATEATVPNDTTLDHETYCYSRKIANIPQAAFDEAKKYAIKGYAFVDMNLNGIKQAIVKADGFNALITVTRDWYGYDGDGPIPLKQDMIGNHELYITRYETMPDGRTLIGGLNSWGLGWGKQGAFSLIYEEWHQNLIEGETAVDMPDDWLNEVHSLPPAPLFKHTFNQNLSFGMRSDEVRQLQIALKIEKTFPASIGETGYFGATTSAAVIGFQHKYNISPASGFVGPLTRAKLNSIYS